MDDTLAPMLSGYFGRNGKYSFFLKSRSRSISLHPLNDGVVFGKQNKMDDTLAPMLSGYFGRNGKYSFF